VQKDGSCNGLGEPTEHETQFVVDRGGQAINSGNIVTLISASTNGFLHGSPEGALTALPGEEEWRFWKMERKAEGASSSEPSAGAATASAQLKEGDVVTLRAFNQRMLEADEKGVVRCSGEGAASEEGAEQTPATQEFVIERVGMGLVKKHDHTLRTRTQICLRPVHQGAAGSGAAGSDGAAEGRSGGYLKVNEDGSVKADGTITQQKIVLTMDLAHMHDMVAPLHKTLQQGDMHIKVSPLWNKNDIKSLNAMSSNWTDDEALAHLKGPVVVASDEGTYHVPNQKGGDKGWVAVVNEGVDIAKAAKQAKLQGATGLIVRCEQVLSLDHMGKKSKDAETPELPTVFVDQSAGEELNERGLVLTGCEFKKRYVTEAIRALGNAAHRGDDVFRALGNGMLEHYKEKQAEPEMEEVLVMEQPAQEEDESQYKWKVSSNTHYLWGKKKMDVNFGKALPPALIKKQKIGGTSKPKEGMAAAANERKSMIGVAVHEAEDIKNLRLASELSEVYTTDAGRTDELEQLAEESDFRIEYKFQEVEVAEGEQCDDLEEEDIMEEQEAIVSTIGVPRKYFYLVALGLLVSSALLLGILFWTLTHEPPRGVGEGDEDEDETDLAAAVPGGRAALPLLRALVT